MIDCLPNGMWIEVNDVKDEDSSSSLLRKIVMQMEKLSPQAVTR